MDGVRLIFPEPDRVRLEPVPVPDVPLASGEILMRTRYSLISPGTELAYFTGRQDLGHRQGWPYPFPPGYAAAGEVLAAGAGVRGAAPGDLILAHTPHQSVVRFDTARIVWAKVPDGLDLRQVPVTRMATVGTTSLRLTQTRPGDFCAVVGLGPVGNAAAQMAQASGFRTIGIDLSPGRLHMAERCGIRNLVSAGDGLGERVGALTGGGFCKLVIECTGRPEALVDALDIAAPRGEVFMVGAAWLRETRVPATDIMRPVFNKFLALRSGWEWDLNRFDDPSNRAGSITDCSRWVMEMMQQGTFRAAEMITHVIAPAEAERAYRGLLHEQERYLGVLIDWTAT